MEPIIETPGKNERSSQKDLFKVTQPSRVEPRSGKKHIPHYSSQLRPVHTPGGHPTSASPFPSLPSPTSLYSQTRPVSQVAMTLKGILLSSNSNLTRVDSDINRQLPEVSSQTPWETTEKSFLGRASVLAVRRN